MNDVQHKPTTCPHAWLATHNKYACHAQPSTSHHLEHICAGNVGLGTRVDMLEAKIAIHLLCIGHRLRDVYCEGMAVPVLMNDRLGRELSNGA